MNQTRPRPYFVPPDFDYDSLPESVQAAVDEIVQPAYDELVRQVPDALERSAGASYVWLLFLELLDQFEIGQQVAHRMRGAESAAPRDKELNRYLKLTASKDKAGSFLVRLRTLRMKSDPSRLPRR